MVPIFPVEFRKVRVLTPEAVFAYEGILAEVRSIWALFGVPRWQVPEPLAFANADFDLYVQFAMPNQDPAILQLGAEDWTYLIEA